MSYNELLKHPKWQKKRLKILERAGFECEYCESKENTLHVHHGYYEKGLKPWEYPDESLHCLCENCHPERQLMLDEIKKLLGKVHISYLEEIFGYLMGIAFRHNEKAWIIIPDDKTEILVGLAGYFDIGYDSLLKKVKENNMKLTAAELYAMQDCKINEQYEKKGINATNKNQNQKVEN